MAQVQPDGTPGVPSEGQGSGEGDGQDTSAPE